MPNHGPLSGVRVVELSGVGAAPFGVMLLADMGAGVVRVDRVGPTSPDYAPNPVTERGRRSVAVDLKHADGVRVVLDLCREADVLVESYRPGVAERLGLGPRACHDLNPALVYARLSGWGQDGPWAQVPGHDINYIGMAGALWAIGRAEEPPVPPLNLVGDLGGGGMSLAFGVVCALFEARGSGRGQVVDASMLDATASLMGFVHGLRAQGAWGDRRGANLLDSGCPYYDVYPCRDGGWVAMGTIEERFFQAALDVLGFDPDDDLRHAHQDRARWPALRYRLAATFAGRSRNEWAERFDRAEACVTPVLDLDEARLHEHAHARQAYADLPGRTGYQPRATPRFSRTGTAMPRQAPDVGGNTDEVLRELGYAAERIAILRSIGVVA